MSRGGETKFRKGQSGNPKGRPRKPKAGVSAFDVVIEKTLSVTQGGVERELTVDEALQLRTYQDALAGNRSARREVLKMIAKREKWLEANRKPERAKPMEWKFEQDPDNANDALVLLGIATRGPPLSPNDEYDRLKLEPWAVEAALQRMRKRDFEEKDLAEMKRCTRDPGSIEWM